VASEQQLVDSKGKFRSFLLLQPRNADTAGLVEFFRQRDILGLAIREAGALAAEVLIPISGVGPVLVTALWDSPEAYAAWRNHPVRATFAGDMERLLLDSAPSVSSGVYEIVLAAVRT